MAYKLEISKAAQADLAKLDKSVLQVIRQRLLSLAENAEQIRHLPLKGRLAGLYKLRVYGVSNRLRPATRKSADHSGSCW